MIQKPDLPEISIRVKVVWQLIEKLSIYITKVEEIKYPVTGEYMGNSTEILKSSLVQRLLSLLIMMQMRSLETLRMRTVKIMRLLNSLYYNISFLVDLV